MCVMVERTSCKASIVVICAAQLVVAGPMPAETLSDLAEKQLLLLEDTAEGGYEVTGDEGTDVGKVSEKTRFPVTTDEEGKGEPSPEDEEKPA